MKSRQGKDCLNELIKSLNQSEEYLIILDSDENHLVSDKPVIRSALEKRGLTSLVTYRHERSRSQPLLWLPDILAWTFARSGEWSKSLSRFATTTKRPHLKHETQNDHRPEVFWVHYLGLLPSVVEKIANSQDIRNHIWS